MVPEKSFGTGISKIWYWKKVLELVSEKFGTDKSTSIGIENIWYRKKVSVSVSFNIFGTVTHWLERRVKWSRWLFSAVDNLRRHKIVSIVLIKQWVWIDLDSWHDMVSIHFPLLQRVKEEKPSVKLNWRFIQVFNNIRFPALIAYLWKRLLQHSKSINLAYWILGEGD